ncbi:MAG: FliM/FliN family flagellar motor switch protein [Campylobacterota bacterium]|nr:FliM/FliN family flagellar motor switch protein [Campylobacterota bacterium]
MASDLSQILQDELANTLEQLLSKTTKVTSVELYDGEGCVSEQCIEVKSKFDFTNVSSTWEFFIPTVAATKFEYFMLGGMGDLKENIDDEIADAVNEIVSNISGSISTSVNAQGFADLGNVKFEVLGNEIVEIDVLKSTANLYKITLDMDGEKILVFIAFSDDILPYLLAISGVESSEASSKEESAGTPLAAGQTPLAGGVSSSLIDDDAAENLKLLMSIKLKLSVRLGTRIFLLKDILRWDVGEIIELEQMVNEPLDILVNGVKIGEGEAVIVENKFGLKIRSIGDEASRLSQIRL